MRIEISYSAANDSFSYPPEHSVLQAHYRPKVAQSQASRPLSSADEAGPVPKKLRSSGIRQRSGEILLKASKLPAPTAAAADDARSKKARARPALTLANIFSPSTGRRQQSAATTSRNATTAGGGKSDREANAVTRRSARLMGGPSKPSIPGKVGTSVFLQSAGENFLSFD